MFNIKNILCKKLSEQMLMVSEINYIKLGVMHLEYAQLYAQEYESSIQALHCEIAWLRVHN